MQTKQYLPDSLKQFQEWQKQLKSIKSKDVELLEPMFKEWMELISTIRKVSQSDETLSKEEQFNYENIEYITRFFPGLKILISQFKFNNGAYILSGRPKKLKEFKSEFNSALNHSISFAKRGMQSDSL